MREHLRLHKVKSFIYCKNLILVILCQKILDIVPYACAIKVWAHSVQENKHYFMHSLHSTY
jgi:hypothetical protein